MKHRYVDSFENNRVSLSSPVKRDEHIIILVYYLAATSERYFLTDGEWRVRDWSAGEYFFFQDSIFIFYFFSASRNNISNFLGG